ncbi:hypothetical protein N7G274_000032 [Stereocaulon virgatum]|uniref:Uncharacterized protein n=1 Tax=Stereocaulon virgatum TaxID=373712 RepID=A0ABR4ATQ7_9LECA
MRRPTNGCITAFAIRGIKALVKTVLTPRCYHGGQSKEHRGVHREAFPTSLEGSLSKHRHLGDRSTTHLRQNPVAKPTKMLLAKRNSNVLTKPAIGDTTFFSAHYKTVSKPSRTPGPSGRLLELPSMSDIAISPMAKIYVRAVDCHCALIINDLD